MRKKVKRLEFVLSCSSYCQETWKKKQQHKDQLAGIKNNRKIKAMGYITHTMNRYPRNGKMGDTDP